MDLDELRTRWQEHDRKLDALLRWNALAVRSAAAGRAEAAARWAGRGLVFELVLALVPILWLGSFAADHVRAPRFFVPAVALDVFAIATVVALARRRAALSALDWSGPVVDIQKQLAAVRLGRARLTLWTLALSPLLWPPLLIVALEGFLGVDAWAAFGAPCIAANFLFGAAVLGAAVWVARRFAGALEGPGFGRRVLAVLGGGSLAASEAALEAVERYARGEDSR